MTFTLPELPYEKSALEPHIDTKTMEIHHDKHHQAYINNLNTALENYPDLQKKSVMELLVDLDHSQHHCLKGRQPTIVFYPDNYRKYCISF